MNEKKYNFSAVDFEQTELSINLPQELSIKFLDMVCCDLFVECKKLEKALLWVIYEQCACGGVVYAKLLIHGQEAFDALGLKDQCPVAEIEKRLFEEETG